MGIPLIQKGNDKLKELLKAAPIYAIIIGLIFNLFKLNLPTAVFTPIDMIGNITIPAALIVLGYRLTEIKVNSFKTAFFASLYKIVFGFIVGLTITFLFGIEGVTRNVIIILATMPSAVMAMILTQKYNRDAELAASVVFLTTLLSIITIPLVLLFLSVY